MTAVKMSNFQWFMSFSFGLFAGIFISYMAHTRHMDRMQSSQCEANCPQRCEYGCMINCNEQADNMTHDQFVECIKRCDPYF